MKQGRITNDDNDEKTHIDNDSRSTYIYKQCVTHIQINLNVSHEFVIMLCKYCVFLLFTARNENISWAIRHFLMLACNRIFSKLSLL